MHTRRVALWAGIATAMIAVGCSSAPGDKAAGDTGPAATSTTAAKAKPAAAFTKADIKLDVKTTSNQCYGSGVGCNVEYVIKPNADKAKLAASGHAWLVTYQVSGVEDGPTTNSFTLQSDSSYESYEVSGFGSTASKSTKLVAKVTEIEAQ